MKIYSVTFITYTNAMRNAVCMIKDGKDSYISTDSNGAILVSECDIEHIKEYGNGIKSMTLVGTLFNKEWPLSAKWG